MIRNLQAGMEDLLHGFLTHLCSTRMDEVQADAQNEALKKQSNKETFLQQHIQLDILRLTNKSCCNG